jgi:predicted transcriptional regulator
MQEYKRRLQEISEQLDRGEDPEEVSVRELLEWFEAQRRGYWIVMQIRGALKDYNLATSPDFRYAYLDGYITFQRADEVQQEESEAAEAAMDPARDPAYRIGKLASANKVPLSVKPDATIAAAITFMLLYDYSQLPVMTSEREVKGMISWRSIGSRLSLQKECTCARECMEPHAEISSDASLFEAIHVIVDKDYVLVRGSDRTINGIVTTSDLSLQFRQLSEPFLLLGEIENYIRKMIKDRFTKEELAEAADPEGRDREIETAADLTFGEYIRLLENLDRWEKLGLSIDRVVFTRDLDRIRVIRNDVMHFDPDGIADSELETLRGFARFLKTLDNIGTI